MITYSLTTQCLRGYRPLVLPLFAALVFPSCKKPEVAPPPPPVVQVMEVKGGDVALTTTLIGQLDSPGNVEIRARVEGFVDQMLFTEGTEVKQGDPLFHLDSKPYEERLAAAKGALAEAQAALNKYEKDVARLAPLARQNAIPQQDLDNAIASVQVGKAAIETAQARVVSAEIDLGYCDIKAPISGLIGGKQVSIGELVGKGEPTLMTTISTLDPIWFYCNVSEVEYLQSMEKSKLTGKQVEDVPLTLIMPDGKEHSDVGKFVFIDRAVDTKTGTLRVRAEFPNKEKLLRPGMFTRVRVDLGTRRNTITVPERAIVELQGKAFVWLIGGDNKTTQHAVLTGEQVGSQIIINEGLKEGDRIIVEGVHKVREGMQVTIVSASPASAAASSEQPLKD